MKRTLGLLLGVVLLLSILPVAAQDDVAQVTALAETEPSPGDGATKPAIWLHPTDLSMSVIIGSDDNDGIGVYDLDGSLLQFVEAGGINNLDLRYNFPLDGENITLVAAGLKDEPTIFFYRMNPETRNLEPISQFDAGIPHNGLCMYHSAKSDLFFVFTNSEDGDFEQYQVADDGNGGITTTLAREFSVGSETEPCVADDELGNLFIGEANAALWRYGAEPEDGTSRKIVDLVGSGHISEEIEGLTLFYGADGSGYVLLANEKSHNFLVYNRDGNNEFVGAFALAAGPTADAVTEPNGIDVIGLPLNDTYPQGLFVTSDETNSDPRADVNFKMASWGEVAEKLGLTIDDSFDPRGVVMAENTYASVTASIETEPVPSGIDAADDPSVWIHPTDPALSTIIGTDKTTGLVVYDLDGSILQQVDIGRMNNVDLRYGFPLGDQQVSIVVSTNRTYNSLEIYTVNPETRLIEDVAAEQVISPVEEVYGVCMYHSAISGKFYAILNSADTGEVEQYELTDNGEGKVSAALVRQFVVGSQTEGCVVDDELGHLYIGEELVGIWKYGAEPDAGEERIQVDSTGPDGNLTADVEGMTIYYADGGTGYLIVSSQGSSEYVVYSREGDNAYVGTFVIVENDTIDAVSGTDGIDVTNFALGEAFPDGVFIAQDDLNLNPESNQNFKLVSWREIAESLGLMIDSSFDPRTVSAQ